jgi:hypothetical protein
VLFFKLDTGSLGYIILIRAITADFTTFYYIIIRAITVYNRKARAITADPITFDSIITSPITIYYIIISRLLTV